MKLCGATHTRISGRTASFKLGAHVDTDCRLSATTTCGRGICSAVATVQIIAASHVAHIARVMAVAAYGLLFERRNRYEARELRE